MAGESKIDAAGFESALRRLERMVEELEGGESGLDGALSTYQQGVHLLTHCYRLLEGAERTVALLTGVDASGNPALAPFDATATAGREGRFEVGDEPTPEAAAATPEAGEGAADPP